VWSRCTDGALLVARVGKMEKAQLSEGLPLLKSFNLLGVVINSCKLTHHQYYYDSYPTHNKS
jgi:Mrp family chromosome partitioning ATPase